MPDRFSNLEIAGAVEIEKDNLQLFSLSCRTLGRNIENEMIKFVLLEHCVKNTEFKLTEKNKWLLEKLNATVKKSNFASRENIF